MDLEITAWNDTEIAIGQIQQDGLVRICIGDETDYARSYVNKDDALQIINHLKEQFWI